MARVPFKSGSGKSIGVSREGMNRYKNTNRQINKSTKNLDSTKGVLKTGWEKSKTNLTDKYGDGTWSGAAKHLGKNMIQGGVAGGAIGGAYEYANGGSFWNGATSGAVNGAMGYGAYRAGIAAAGVKGAQVNALKGVKESFKNVNSGMKKMNGQRVGAGVKEHYQLKNNVNLTTPLMGRDRSASRI